MADRVVSLLPSTTEIVAALGHTDRLVGRSHECDHPPEVAGLPVVSRPRREPVGSSRQIHDDVVAMLREVLSVYRVDPAALRASNPDLIITQDLCEVCAVAEDEVVRAARTYLGEEVRVLTSSPLTLADVDRDVRRIAEALGEPEAAERLVGELHAGFDHIRAAVSGRDRPRLVMLEWTDPLMTGGNWAPELIEIAGARSVLGAAGGHSPRVTMEALAREDPDVILVAPCGYDLGRTSRERRVLEGQPGWDELSAVRAGRVYDADGSAYFNRPGPRLVTSAAIVAAVVHGVGPATDLEGRAWQRHA